MPFSIPNETTNELELQDNLNWIEEFDEENIADIHEFNEELFNDEEHVQNEPIEFISNLESHFEHSEHIYCAIHRLQLVLQDVFGGSDVMKGLKKV